MLAMQLCSVDSLPDISVHVIDPDDLLNACH